MKTFLLLSLVATALALKSCASIGKHGKPAQARKCKATTKDAKTRGKVEGGAGCHWNKKLAKTIRKYDKMAKTWEAGGHEPDYERPETACFPITCGLFSKKKSDCYKIGSPNVEGSCKFVKKNKNREESICLPGKVTCKELEGGDRDTCEKDESGIKCFYHRPTKSCRDIPGTPPCNYFKLNEKLCRKVIHDDTAVTECIRDEEGKILTGKALDECKQAKRKKEKEDAKDKGAAKEKAPEPLKLCKMSDPPEGETPTCIDFADPPENCYKLNGLSCRGSKRCAWFRPNKTCYPTERIPETWVCDHFTRVALEDEMNGDEVVKRATRSDCKQRANLLAGLACDWNYATDKCEEVGSYTKDMNNRPCWRKPRRRCLKDQRCRWEQGIYADVGECKEIADFVQITCAHLTSYVKDLAGKTRECAGRASKMNPPLFCAWDPVTEECAEDVKCSNYTVGRECRRAGCEFKKGTCQDP